MANPKTPTPENPDGTTPETADKNGERSSTQRANVPDQSQDPKEGEGQGGEGGEKETPAA